MKKKEKVSLIREINRSYDPEADMVGSARGTYGHRLAEKILSVRGGFELSEKPVRINYETFGKLVARSGVLVDHPLADTETKRDILMRSNYEVLWTGEGEISIYGASPARVGQAFRNVHRAYKRALMKKKK